MVAIYGWRHDGRGWGPVAGTFDEKERMVVAIINRICIFAITYFTDKSEFTANKTIIGEIPFYTLSGTLQRVS